MADDPRTGGRLPSAPVTPGSVLELGIAVTLVGGPLLVAAKWKPS